MTVDLELAAAGTLLLMVAAYLLGRSVEHGRLADGWDRLKKSERALLTEWGKLNYSRYLLERDRVVYEDQRREARRGLS